MALIWKGQKKKKEEERIQVWRGAFGHFTGVKAHHSR